MGDLLVFAVDGVLYSWTAPTVNPFSTNSLIVSLLNDSVNVSTGQSDLNNSSLTITNHFGHLVFESSVSIEIGFGLNKEKDLSACSKIGLNPGWRAIAGQDNWLSDTGVSFGLSRSPVNLKGKNKNPDFKALYRVEKVVSPMGGVQGQPVILLDYSPLEDVAGYGEDVFFQLFSKKIVDGQEVPIVEFLKRYEDLVYNFAERFVMLLETHSINPPTEILNKTADLSLGATQIVPETMYGIEPNPTFGLFVNEGDGLQKVELDTQFHLLPQPGVARLINKYGDLLGFGFLGSWNKDTDTFTNIFPLTEDSFLGLNTMPGHKLKILSGDSKGYYIVKEVVDANTIRVSPNFLFDSGSNPVAWEIYDGYTRDVYDPSLIADISYDSFNHLSEEVLKIRLLSWVSPVEFNTSFFLDLGNSLINEHPISLRFGKEGDEVTLYRLKVETLGVIANSSLYVPDSDRFSSQAFQIQIGTERYNPVFVADADWQSQVISLNDVYVNTTTREIKFGDSLLSNNSNMSVSYYEIARFPQDIPSGTAEFDAFTGACVISTADQVSYSERNLYFVQQMNTNGNTDVVCNPIAGSVFFLSPLKERRIVEIEYFVADDLGQKLLDEATGQPIHITEQLPLYIRLEKAVFVETNVFEFNLPDLTGFRRTVFSEVTPRVWVGGFQCNYGEENCVVENNLITLTLEAEVGSDQEVFISYAVFESLGGEQVYTTSRRPIFRPPFFIEEEKDTFTLETDRTEDLKVGMLFRLADSNFYIKEVTYDATEDLTTVKIFPPTIEEVGSRSPNNEVLTLVSSEPIALSIDPNEPVDNSQYAYAGFLFPLSDPLLGGISWMSVNRGQDKIDFLGDITQFAVPGHILEIGGVPYTIANASLTEDGLKTIVEITSYFVSGHSMATDEIKISVRPIYPPFSRNFTGLGKVLTEHPHTVILFGEKNEEGKEKAGRELIRGVHYEIDLENGNLFLLPPIQAPQLSQQIIYINHTKVRTLEPTLDPQSQQLLIPNYSAKAKVLATPTEENNLLGATIKGKYTFWSPDSFYARVVPLQSFAAETLERIGGVTVSSPQGPISSEFVDPQPFDKGFLSFETQRSNLTDDDRSARIYLEFYNTCVNSFEQVTEAISGIIIGDRDGKFRFFVGRGKEIAPKGYEDEITGILNPRNIWGMVFESEAGFAFDPKDDLKDPRTVDLISTEITGDDLDPDDFDLLSRRQKVNVKNDIDDVFLTSRGRFRLRWFDIYRKGVFENGSQPSLFSRLFPEITSAFFVTSPGLQSNIGLRATGAYSEREDWSGWYSFTRELEPATWSWEGGFQPSVRGSTYRKEIATISNPVLGPIKNISDTTFKRRYPRARIWGYYPDGVEANAFGTGFPATAISKPFVIATPLLLSEFPVDPETGGPDMAKLIANGGDFFDLSTGDLDLATPAWSDFEGVMQVGFGFPNGQKVTPLFSDEAGSGIIASEILHGCIITFSGGFPSDVQEVSFSDQIMLSDENGDPSTVVSLERGDTIYIIEPVSAYNLEEDFSDPPTFEELEQLSKLANSYNSPFDVIIEKKTGRLKDRSFLNHKNTGAVLSGPWFGQNPPFPMTELEGEVAFTYPDMSFLEIPALKGEGQNDSGDYTLPYMRTKSTERDRFAEISRISADLLTERHANSGQYLYPDEIRGDDGFILGALSGQQPPAALITIRRHNPQAFLNTIVGKNDVREFDLLLTEYSATTSLPLASQGILSVGRVYRNSVETLDGQGGGTVSEYSCIEPPRFVSPTAQGGGIRYRLQNAMVHIHDNTSWDWSTGSPPNGGYNDTNTSGVVIHENQAGELALDFSSLGQIELGDGTGTIADPTDPTTWGGKGGFNRLFQGGSKTQGNSIIITLFAREQTNSAVISSPVLAGDRILSLEITDNGQLVKTTYSDGSTTSSTVTSTTFGIWSTSTYQQSGSTEDFKVILSSGVATPIIDLLNHTEIPSTLDNNTNIYTTDYAFDFSITVSAESALTDKGSFTGFIESDRLTFTEVYDLRYARPRGFRHPVGKQMLQTTLTLLGADTKDYYGNLQTVELDNSLSGTNYTFLERANDHLSIIPDVVDTHYKVGGFVKATSEDNADEKGSLRVMAFEGNMENISFIQPAQVSVIVEDVDDTGDGNPDRFGVITQVNVTSNGSVTNLPTGTVISVVVTGAGRGAELEATLNENGTLELGDSITILNGGSGYITPSVSIIHNFENTPIVSDNITFSLVPSCDYDTSTQLFVGTAKLEKDSVSIITETTPLSGNLSKVEKGDLVIVRASNQKFSYNNGGAITQNLSASNATGTYIVRSALEPNLSGFGFIGQDLSSNAHAVKKKVTFPSTEFNMLKVRFPSVTQVDYAAEVTVAEDVSFADSPSGHYFGLKGCVSHLLITNPGTGFTSDDIGSTQIISNGDNNAEVTIVDVDGQGGVKELSITNRGTNYPTNGNSISFQMSPIDTSGTDCLISAYITQEQNVFFVLKDISRRDESIAVKVPFTSISTIANTSSTITIDWSSIGTANSEFYIGSQQLSTPTVQITLPDGQGGTTDTYLTNTADMKQFVFDLISNSYLSGHKYIPLNLRENLNSDRYVGKRYAYTNNGKKHISSYGFVGLTLRNSSASVTPTYIQFYCYPFDNGNLDYFVSERFRENDFAIVSKPKSESNVFHSDKDTIVYDETPIMLDLQAVSDDPSSLPPHPIRGLHLEAVCFVREDNLTASGNIHDTTDPTYYTSIVPTGYTNAVGLDFLDEGFIAKDGIYIEPSSPLPAQDYVFSQSNAPRVVEDTSPAVLTTEIGFKQRDYDEEILVYVRRIRRFHEIQTSLQGSIHPLRFAYEIRRGVPTSYSVDNKGHGELSALSFTFQPDNPAFIDPSETYIGTQLGGFDEEDVNIQSGDIVRLLKNGVLVDSAEILRIGKYVSSQSSYTINQNQTLTLRAPGFIDEGFLAAVASNNLTNYSFEVYLSNAIIPHEQSNEQLFSLVTERVVNTTRANMTTQKGGYVPHIPLLSQTPNGLGEIDEETGSPKTWINYSNKLYDDLNAPNPNDFFLMGVDVGDIVIIDSAGKLSGPTGSLDPEEKGSRPFGDMGIIDREDGGANSAIGRNAYEAGTPSSLDDNRGFYKVVTINSDHLEVQSAFSNTYVGSFGMDITFPEQAVIRQELGYTLYPTIHNSNLNNSNFFAQGSDGTEGQMDLRPTQFAGIKNDGTPHPDVDKENSFSVNDFSIRPFSYRIVRPNILFSEETIEFVLLLRERTLSLIEHLRNFMVIEKSGDYYTFQDNQHIEDLGTPLVPESGLGVYHNSYVEDIIGRTDLSPFCNDSDCLSLLDRRFIIQDSSLDELAPDDTGIGSWLVSNNGGTPYTAFTDTDDFFNGASGSLVRPLLLDHIDIILNDRDLFRDLRSTWIDYRTHRTEGILSNIRRFDESIEKRKIEQQNYYLRLLSQKKR